MTAYFIDSDIKINKIQGFSSWKSHPKDTHNDKIIKLFSYLRTIGYSPTEIHQLLLFASGCEACNQEPMDLDSK